MTNLEPATPCACGHVLDEHVDDFLAPCTIVGCDCDCFDEPDWEDDEQ